MPRQQRYNDGAEVRTTAGGDPRISAARGVTLNGSALMGALEVPLLDASGAVAEARGWQSVGAGLAQVGGALGQIAVEKQKIVNENDFNEFQAAQQAAQLVLKQKIGDEPDYKKWGKIAEDTVSKYSTMFLTNDYAPVVKERVAIETKKWQNNTKVGVELASFERAKNIRDGGIEKTRLQGITGANLEQANAATARKEELGILGPGDAEKERIDNENQVKHVVKKQEAEYYDTIRNMVIADVTTQGLKPVLELIDDPEYGKGLLDEVARQGLRDTAQAVYADRQQEIYDGAVEAILSGQGSTAAIEALPDSFVPEKLKAKLKGTLTKVQNVDRKAEVAKVAPTLAAAMDVEVRNYDPKSEKDPNVPVKYYEMMGQIAELPTAYRASLRKALKDARFPSKSAEQAKGPTEVVFGQLKNYFDQGAFGSWKGTPGPFGAIDNYVEKGKAQFKLGQARDEWRQWASDHPDAMLTDPDTQKEMNRLFSKYAGAEFITPTLIPSPTESPSAPTTSVESILQKYGVSAQMDRGGGNILLPRTGEVVNPTPAKPQTKDRRGVPVPDLPDGFDENDPFSPFFPQ